MLSIKKVLLVDDEVHIRKYIGLVVKSTLDAPEIIEAPNGAEGLKLFKQERPDLVLLDINMPVRDGLETLADIMEHDSDALVVMLTSVSTRASIEKAATLGAAGYILKDTPRDEISRSLRELIEEVFGDA